MLTKCAVCAVCAVRATLVGPSEHSVPLVSLQQMKYPVRFVGQVGFFFLICFRGNLDRKRILKTAEESPHAQLYHSSPHSEFRAHCLILLVLKHRVSMVTSWDNSRGFNNIICYQGS